MLDYLTNVDHHNDEAMVAVTVPDLRRSAVATSPAGARSIEQA